MLQTLTSDRDGVDGLQGWAGLGVFRWTLCVESLVVTSFLLFDVFVPLSSFIFLGGKG